MKKYSRVCAEINLDHFEHNLDEIRRVKAMKTKVCAVIKADATATGQSRWRRFWRSGRRSGAMRYRRGGEGAVPGGDEKAGTDFRLCFSGGS